MYNSLFDRVSASQFISPAPDEMAFDGCLEDALTVLEYSDPNLEGDLLQRLFMAPRVLRSALDFQYDNKRGLRLVKAASDVLRDSYTKNFLTGSLDSFRIVLSDFGINPECMKISQKKDDLSWNSYAPSYTRRSVDAISSKGSVCLIPLAHGGVSVGMDAYLRLQERNPFTEYSFFPVRFSRTKYCDETPDLSSRAVVNHINSISEGKEIVIFDEDENSGNTIAIAKACFEKKFPDRIISTQTNLESFSYAFTKKAELNNC